LLSSRIIPCLDIKDGRTVKGVNFEGLRDAGDPIELAQRYAREGADELVFLDITATKEKRKTLVELVREIARHLDIPFTVGGGIRSVDEISDLLQAGADKVSLNSSIVVRPELIREASDRFGAQCVVAAIDARRIGGPTGSASTGESSHGSSHEPQWTVWVKGGSEDTGIDVLEWIMTCERLGAGEILLTSMDRDGTKAGFDLELLRRVNAITSLPVIASGGAGTIAHCIEAITEGKADAVLAASIFHFREIEIRDLKEAMRSAGVEVRL
jgi:imidazole glycerol-phosphate synthase subunit HisF